MATTIKLPNALLQNQAAVMIDFMDGGACVNEKVSPGIESHTSPNIIKMNCGNCHNIDNLVSLFWWDNFSISICRIPAQKNDNAAHIPPTNMLLNGANSILNFNSMGTMTLCQSGIIINNRRAPKAFAWKNSRTFS